MATGLITYKMLTEKLSKSTREKMYICKSSVNVDAVASFSSFILILARVYI